MFCNAIIHVCIVCMSYQEKLENKMRISIQKDHYILKMIGKHDTMIN